MWLPGECHVNYITFCGHKLETFHVSNALSFRRSWTPHPLWEEGRVQCGSRDLGAAPVALHLSLFL